jgi:hypothetical protein
MAENERIEFTGDTRKLVSAIDRAAQAFLDLNKAQDVTIKTLIATGEEGEVVTRTFETVIGEGKKAAATFQAVGDQVTIVNKRFSEAVTAASTLSAALAEVRREQELIGKLAAAPAIRPTTARSAAPGITLQEIIAIDRASEALESLRQRSDIAGETFRQLVEQVRKNGLAVTDLTLKYPQLAIAVDNLIAAERNLGAATRAQAQADREAAAAAAQRIAAEKAKEDALLKGLGDRLTAEANAVAEAQRAAAAQTAASWEATSARLSAMSAARAAQLLEESRRTIGVESETARATTATWEATEERLSAISKERAAELLELSRKTIAVESETTLAITAAWNAASDKLSAMSKERAAQLLAESRAETEAQQRAAAQTTADWEAASANLYTMSRERALQMLAESRASSDAQEKAAAETTAAWKVTEEQLSKMSVERAAELLSLSRETIAVHEREAELRQAQLREELRLLEQLAIAEGRRFAQLASLPAKRPGGPPNNPGRARAQADTDAILDPVLQAGVRQDILAAGAPLDKVIGFREATASLKEFHRTSGISAKEFANLVTQIRAGATTTQLFDKRLTSAQKAILDFIRTEKILNGTIDETRDGFSNLLQLFSLRGLVGFVGFGILLKSFSALTTAISTATRAAIDFEIKLAQIKTIDSASISTSQWADQLTRLSSAFGIDILDQASAAYQSLSNQIGQGAQAFLFLEEANKFAVATVSSAKDSVDLLSATINAFGLDVTQTNQIAGSFFKTIEEGRIVASELANDFGRIAIPAATLGVSLNELQAALAVTTIRGVGYAESATSEAH